MQPTQQPGEALPPFYIFDSCSKTSENYRVKVEWLVGLPSVMDVQPLSNEAAFMQFRQGDPWTIHCSTIILRE
jgi:hypothetical protein